MQENRNGLGQGSAAAPNGAWDAAGVSRHRVIDPRLVTGGFAGGQHTLIDTQMYSIEFAACQPARLTDFL